MPNEIKNRVYGFLWGVFGLGLVSVATYVSGVGDVFSLDVKTLVNVYVMAVSTLFVEQVTKYLNR